MLVDTHTHIYDEAYGGRADELAAAFDADGLAWVNAVGADLPSSRECVALAARNARVYAVVGVHPEAAEAFGSEEEAELIRLAAHPKAVAIGEIGLDYHYDYPKDAQRRAFERQLDLAWELRLPVVLHVRDAYGDALEILTAHRDRLAGGVMHCYSGSPEMVPRFLELGLYVSFAGSVTFKNNKKAADCIRAVPLNRVLTETDCPYLTPEPHRGRLNYPAYVRFVAQKLAEVYGIPVEELAERTRANAEALFGVSGNCGGRK